jgi:hypothetical protein
MRSAMYKYRPNRIFVGFAWCWNPTFGWTQGYSRTGDDRIFWLGYLGLVWEDFPCLH